MFKVTKKLKNVKLGLKLWTIASKDPKRLMQGKLDGLRLEAELAIDKDPSNEEKCRIGTTRKDDPIMHFENLEQDDEQFVLLIGYCLGMETHASLGMRQGQGKFETPFPSLHLKMENRW